MLLVSRAGAFALQDPTQSEAPTASQETSQTAQQAPGETIVTGRRDDEPDVVDPTPLDRVGSRDVLQDADLDRIAPVSLNEIVQRLPGVSTRPYNGGDFVAPNFAIRGLPDDGLTEYILTTIDGVPANPMPYGWTAMSFFPLLPDEVAGVELIKGGFAVRYSPNTVGGVLNFLTPPIPLAPTFRAKALYGSYDFTSALFSYGDTNGRFGYLVTGGTLSGDGYRVRGEFESQGADAKLRWDLGQGDWLSTHVAYHFARHQRPGGLTVAQFDADPFQNTRPTNYHQGDRTVADATLHRDDGSGDFTEVYSWLSSTYNRIDGPTPYSDTATTHRQNTYTQWNANVGARQERGVNWGGTEHRLHYGARASYEWLPSRGLEDTPLAGGPTVVTSDVEYEVAALSAHVDDTFRPVDDLSVTLGVRAEYIPVASGHNDTNGEDFDEEFFDVLPAAGLSYEISETTALFASYQQSFRAPQVFGFGTATGPLDDDQGLEFEHGQGAEVGVRWRPGAGVETSLVGWHTDFDDVGITVNSIYETIGNVVANGVDVTTDWDAGDSFDALRGWRAGASATLQDSELEEAAVATNDGNQTPYAWDEKLTWYVEHEAENRWVYSIDGYYIGESFADDANTETENPAGTLGINPSRTIWNAGVRKSFELDQKGRIELSLRVTNLFDEEWFLHTRLGGKLIGAPQMAFFTLELSF